MARVAFVRSKAWYRSRGTWGSVIGAAAAAVGYWDQATGTDEHMLAALIGGAFGAILSFIGRWDAYRPIHLFRSYTVRVEVETEPDGA